MGDVRKKYRVYRLISREKIFSWRLMLEKKSYAVVSQGTIGLGIFFLHQPNHTYPASKVKWSVF